MAAAVVDVSATGSFVTRFLTSNSSRGVGMHTTGTPEVFEMLGGQLEQLITIEDRGDAVLFRTTMEPGKSVPLHSHSDPEAFYVLSGRVDVFVLNTLPQWRSVVAGESITVEHGSRHALRNTSNESADLIVLTNRRLAAYFRQAGRKIQQGTPPTPPSAKDIERMIAAAAEFSYWMASPEESEAVTGSL